MDDTIDLLKIKIEKAKRELPLETVNAIDSFDWRAAILGLRSKYGYTFEQLGDLELETELLLCGLLSAENYPKELETRLRLSKSQTNELVNEMNSVVFRRIQEELIKNIERRKIPEKISTPTPSNISQDDKNDTKILNSAGIEILSDRLELPAGDEPGENREKILQKIEKPEPVHPMFAQKLSAPVSIPLVKTVHSLNNMSSTQNTVPAKNKVDPYREVPE